MKSASFLIFILIAVNAVASENYKDVPENSLQGVVRTNLDSPEPTKEQLDRKLRYTKMVETLGGPVNNSLPVTEDPNRINPRTSVEIAKRAIAVALAAVKGEGMPHEEVLKMVVEWGADSYFSPEESKFINNPSASESERIKFAWRYEGLDVLLWALGYKSKLPMPDEICDVKTDVGIVVKNRSMQLASNSKPRSMSEIMDMADFYYRLNWAAVELRINGKENSKINEEIIMERHYALNWLIRYMGQKWDEISTDT